MNVVISLVYLFDTLALVAGENYGVGLETDRPHQGEYFLLALILGLLLFLITVIGILAINFTLRGKKTRTLPDADLSLNPPDFSEDEAASSQDSSSTPQWSRKADWWKNTENQ